MPEQNLDSLKSRLLQAGLRPSYVARMLAELDDHVQDLREEALRQGQPETAANGYALECLGRLDLLAERIAAQPGIRSWPYRHPLLRKIGLPGLYGATTHAGAINAGVVMRWCASLMLAAAITASMLLVMQLSIVLT